MVRHTFARAIHVRGIFFGPKFAKIQRGIAEIIILTILLAFSMESF